MNRKILRKHPGRRLIGIGVVTIVLTLLALFCPEADAANHYIRVGASGANDGSDWTDAWTDHPATWVRGDTYYYADGEIDTGGSTEYLSTAESGTSVITIKKATVADHGTETGWDNAYGDGTFHFTASTKALYISTGYWAFDGQTGGGWGSWKTGFGFKVSMADSTNENNTAVVYVQPPSGVMNSVTIRHTEIQGAGYDNWEPVADGYNNKQQGVFVRRTNDFTLEYCYVHDNNQTHHYAQICSGLLVQHNWMEARRGEPHGEGIVISQSGMASGNIVRYNVFYRISGAGAIAVKDSDQGHMYIYENIMFEHDNSEWVITNAAITNTGAFLNHNMFVANNTVYGYTAGRGGVHWSNAGTNNTVYNHLIINSGTPPSPQGVHWAVDNTEALNEMIMASNASDEENYAIDVDITDIPADVFTSLTEGSEDFTPQSGWEGAGQGVNLDSLFTIDIAGNPITNWDIGALQSDASSDTTHNPITDWVLSQVVSDDDSLASTFSKVVSANLSIDSITVNLSSDSSWVTSTADTNAVALGIGGLTTGTEYTFHLRTYQHNDTRDFYKTSNEQTATVWEVGVPEAGQEFHYSANSENGSGTGTFADPFNSAADAIAALDTPGDTLTIRGTIYDSDDLVPAVDSLLFRSDPDLPDSIATLSGEETITGFAASGGGGGAATVTNNVADDDCYFNSAYYEEWDSNDILMTGDAFADSSSFIIKVTIPADYASNDSVTVRLPDIGHGVTVPRTNWYIEDKTTATSITTAATYNLALGDSGSTHLLIEYGDTITSAGDTLYFDIGTLIDEAISDGTAPGATVNICVKVIDTEGAQYVWWDALEASDKPAYVKWDYSTGAASADSLYYVEVTAEQKNLSKLWIDGILATEVAIGDLDALTEYSVGDDTVYVWKYETTQKSIQIDGQATALIDDGQTHIRVENIRFKHFNGSTLKFTGTNPLVMHVHIESVEDGIEGTESVYIRNAILRGINDKTYIAPGGGFNNDYNWVSATASYTNESAGANSVTANPLLNVDYTFPPNSPLRAGLDSLGYAEIGAWADTFAVEVISPNGAEVWQGGTVENITWNNTGLLKVKIEYSDNGGVSYITLSDSTDATTETFPWTVTEGLSATSMIKLTDVHSGTIVVSDVSDGYFGVTAGVTATDNRFSENGKWSGIDPFGGNAKFGTSPW